MDLELADKALLVVGGTSGMGYATARVLASEGAHVVVTGRDQAKADAAAAELASATGADVAAVTGDMSRPGVAAEVVGTSVERLGGLDGLAVLTGLLGHEGLDISDERWTEVFADVMLSTSRTVEAALPHLVERNGNLVTTAAYSIRAPEAVRLPYASMKAAVAVYTKGIAKEYGEHGVRANCVCPGAIETEALAALRQQVAEARGYPVEEALERVMVEEWGLDVALGRPGKPEEVGALIAFLLSGRAGYLTGALLNIDGGTNF